MFCILRFAHQSNDTRASDEKEVAARTLTHTTHLLYGHLWRGVAIARLQDFAESAGSRLVYLLAWCGLTKERVIVGDASCSQKTMTGVDRTE